MTTQIDHSLNTYPHNYMTTSYKVSRRDRLVDIIGDYITDEETTAVEIYNDIISEITTWADYHEKYLEKCRMLKKMVNGHRPVGNDYYDKSTGLGAEEIQYLAEDILAL